MNKKIKISLNVMNPNSFIKDLIRRKIKLYDISKKNKELEITIDEESLEEIRKIKTIKKIKIKDYYGISKIKYLYHKNKLIIYLILFCIFINLVLSNIIFKIEIDTSNKSLKKTVQKDLEELGLKKYHFKISYEEREKIKNKLQVKEKDKIEWLEIKEQGTKYIIKIEEKKIKEKEQVCNPRNIISKKNARITRIHSSSGEIVKKINDYVEPGEVLISGLIHNKEKIVSKKCSEGIVYGETWYKIKVSVPKKYTEAKKTNQKRWGIFFKTPKKEININNKFQIYEKKEYNIIESNIINFGLGIAEYREIERKEYNNDLKTVDSIAYNYAEEKLKQQFNNKLTIIRKKILKKTEYNSKITVEVFFAIEEDIVSYQDITNLDIEEMNKKEE